MNVHHLELFYYVARHKGITEAVRKMPYGIQQPAVSGQLIQLEEYLGVKLFQRRPFALTKQGEMLYEFVQPFFENLQPMAEKLRGGTVQRARIGASEIVLRDHLPDLLRKMRRLFPRLRVTLRECYYPQVVDLLTSQEIDLSIGLLGPVQTSGVASQPMFQLPLILMVPKASKLKSADELWQQDRIEEPLITVPTNEPICRTFQQELARRKVDWFPSVEVSTLELVQTYVANGYGIGVTVAVPKAKLHPQVRVLPLPDFPKIDFGVMWMGKATPIVKAFIAGVEEAARALLA